MWHEARKQEKKIRGMMVDFKRRAERRRDYNERIKQDPAQFLQVHGRPAKVHLDPAVAIAADSPATMMPWQGNPGNLIDRFDVRAHLDIIPEYKPTIDLPKLRGEELKDDRKACYERYRTLVQNDFLGLNEDKFLNQIFLEERFGPVLKPAGEEEKKKLVDKKAAIGYVYEDSTTYDPPQTVPLSSKIPDDFEDEEEKDDLSDIDLDVTVDVSELSEPQCSEMNEHSHKYGMIGDDFISYLLEDKDEADQLRLAREIEEEKAMFSGRNSRRERRALREKKLAGRKITSPPSYAARDSPTYTPIRHSTSKSRSRSKSPPNAGKIMFITSFGDEGSDGEGGHHKTGNSSPKKDSKGNSAKKHDKTSRSSTELTPETVIGPLLPEDMTSQKKKPDTKDKPKLKDKRSASSSGSSSSRSRKDRYNKRHTSSSKSKKHRRSSSSSSGSSYNRMKQSKRRYSRSRSRSKVRSRSRTPRSRSRSYKVSREKRSTESHSRSRSHSARKSVSPQLPPPPVKSYYRHSLSRSNSDLSDDSDSQDRKEDFSPGRSSGLIGKASQLLSGRAGNSTQPKLTPQERLKRRMQIALNRQYKADKRAQMQKSEKQLQEKMDREEELREMAIKLRQRERERRHKLRGYGYESDSDTSFTKWEREGNHDRKDSPDRGRNRHYSSSDEEERPPAKEADSKHRRRDSSSGERRRNSPVSTQSATHRNTEACRKVADRNSPRRSPHRSSQRKFSPPNRSRSDTRDRHHSYESQKSRSRSPSKRCTRESSYSRRDRRSRSKSSSSRTFSRTSGRGTRSLVDY